MSVSIVTNEDNMVMMSRYPDKFFDLAVVDPPYGLGKKLTDGGGKHLKFKNHKEIQNWDVKPNDEYFTELFRVSKNQIIWGGNYFELGPCRGFIIWDKQQPAPNFSACEFAWTSIDGVSKMFRYRMAGCFGEVKIHPTQKPVDLYKFLLHHFAVPGDKILDTHLGSQSSRIAAYDMGFDFYGCELDKDYFEAGCKRFNQHIAQLTIFA
jgi:site-specific DNA-methyltransferase (adenine-specific)